MLKRAMTEFPQYRHDWKVVSKSYTKTQPSGRKIAIYNAECPKCGSIKELSITHMKQNQSCGCTKYKTVSDKLTKHGDAKRGARIRLNSIWGDMRRRCRNTPSSIKKYPYHAGKGVRVCDEWQDYSVFKVWALANGYEDNLSIDRRDGSKDYEPSNCRWVDDFTQAQNKDIRGNNSSGYTGVRVISRSGVRVDSVKYHADITHDGNRVNLGRFNTAEDAVIARNNYIINNRTEHKVQIVLAKGD